MLRSLYKHHGLFYTVLANLNLISNLSMAHQNSIIASRYPSVHSAGISEVHDVPIHVLIRPIPSSLEQEKVSSLMETIKVRCSLLLQKWPCKYYYIVEMIFFVICLAMLTVLTRVAFRRLSLQVKLQSFYYRYYIIRFYCQTVLCFQSF